MPEDLFPASDPSDGKAALDDCWNRIGVHGDQRCERLAEWVHCRNCEVYARAAATLLDRIASQPTARPDHGPADAHRGEGEPLLIFRVAEEWFGLPARFVAQVAPTAPMHSLPKLRSKAVLGLANVAGQLTVCVSLARLLDLRESSGLPSLSSGAERGAIARFVVTRDAGGDRARERRADEVTVFPVDEVHGIVRFSHDEHQPVPATLAHAAAVHTRSLVSWHGKAVGILDSTLLFETLRRSLG